jgi:hypothetical protein
MTDDIETLKTQIATLTEKVADLEAKAKPKPAFVPGPVGPTTSELAMSRLSMPASALAEMLKATPDELMRDIAGDARRQSTLSSLGGEPPVRQRGSGWSESIPLSNPPGVAIADKIMDVADARERAELIEKEARRLAAAKK